MGVFVASFLLYLATLFPGVAPYRDTGEMASVAATLGIAHPPGYPLYTLLARMWTVLLPVGDVGFRLNVLSALFGAATVWMAWRAVVLLSGRAPGAFLAPLVLATSYLQWYLSLVSEMYTINTFFAAAILFLAISLSRQFESRVLYLMCLLFGVGLGNRLDLVMLAPVIAAAPWGGRHAMGPRHFATAVAFFFVGVSVFLYLPFRSHVGPLLDWNHPATLDSLWSSVTRRTHGGTLDLISAPYASGENFGAGMSFYFKHLLEGFGYIGLPLALFGLIRWWRSDRYLAAGSLVSWCLAAPVFIHKANMPPNPHALAILEAHFLLPNLIVFVWAGIGMLALAGAPRSAPAGDKKALPPTPRAVRSYLPAFCALCMIGANLHADLPELFKRTNFIAYDYARNMQRSLPPGSTVVVKKDVQLFALWNQRFAADRRQDLALVSQGLAGSLWYQNCFRKHHPSVVLGPLSTEEEWRAFLSLNYRAPVFVSGDTEYPHPAAVAETPQGLVTRVGSPADRLRADMLLTEIYPYRGVYLYTGYREFFTPDIIDGYAKASMELGRYWFARGRYAEARRWFSDALRMNPLFPLAENYLGYIAANEGNCRRALEHYRRAVEGFEHMYALARQYRSLPDLQESILRDESGVWVSAGYCEERLGNDGGALNAYQKAIDCWPRQARAYYNRGVIYWKRADWHNVVAELENALRADPQFAEAGRFLLQAQRRAGMRSVEKRG